MATERTRNEDVRRLGELIADLGVAMMTTVEPDGTLRSRPMQTHVDGEFDGTLWFFTREHSTKVFDIGRDRHVNLGFACPKSEKYVSIAGKARLVQDRQRAERMWTPAYEAWFPKGLDDPELALIRVEADKGEFWDTAPGAVVHAVGYLKAKLTGESHKPADHEKVDL
ncbi:pyridoxamine 5'-phosphate oxidase family protein [Tautonia plasticadhaerens]|uniref:General stress protein 26 n=1 Tax=Tautonia plasticadhaerens TaxID=2527974 RepID=A0A518GXB4_9BACT|nr:pyridoxamine 5'-phosphate oxidase family protein [Tautonia plasticadhaerens]QDV33221.1 General stress protein 26 [Tautonia plasticadhaerens]